MKIGIIGSGVMGQGIVQAFAQSGMKVLFAGVRPSLDSPNKGKQSIERILNKRKEKGKMTEEQVEEILNNITPSLQEDFVDCDLIVEAGREDMELKKQIFEKLDEICKEETIFATNTSSLSITELSLGLSHEVIGMHFFNPAAMMKLVEIIPGMHTSEATIQKITELSEQIGKEPVIVQESPGFVVNRILIPLVNEGITLYAEGISDAKGIDTAMKLGANLPMGPLELGDLIGLDVCLAIMETLQNETGDNKYRPHTLLRKMVRANKLGRKTGEGFHKYL